MKKLKTRGNSEWVIVERASERNPHHYKKAKGLDAHQPEKVLPPDAKAMEYVGYWSVYNFRTKERIVVSAL